MNETNKTESEEADELLQYFVVNTELIMSGPKLGVQIGHAATLSTRKLEKLNDPIFNEWLDSYSQKKILLGGKQKDLERLIDQGFIPVRDNGLTEIPAGSLTVVVLPPMLKLEAKQYIKRLQLLKDK
jgi:PTH2 family peptidyl-tRNA hydrolase